MSILGSNVAQSIAGSAQAERVAARETDRAKDPRPRAPRAGKDEFERHVSEVESTEAVEGLSDQQRREEAGERGRRDPRTAMHRQPHGYDATGSSKSEDSEPKIDIKG